MFYNFNLPHGFSEVQDDEDGIDWNKITTRLCLAAAEKLPRVIHNAHEPDPTLTLCGRTQLNCTSPAGLHSAHALHVSAVTSPRTFSLGLRLGVLFIALHCLLSDCFR
jgi:hypothetical protein